MAAPAQVFEKLTSDCNSPSAATAWPLSVPLSLKTLTVSVAWLSASQSLKRASDADSLSHNPVSLAFNQYSEQHGWLYPSAALLLLSCFSSMTSFSPISFCAL